MGDYISAETRVREWLHTLSNAEAGYAEECWIVFQQGVKFGTLYTMDMEEEMPALPFDVAERQGYMIRQTLFDFALQLKAEKS